MIEHLIMSGISKKTIDQVLKRESEFYCLTLNEEECLKIITYLKFLGITNINEIFQYRLELFLNTKEEVVNMFEKYNIAELVTHINENYENIDILFE